MTNRRWGVAALVLAAGLVAPGRAALADDPTPEAAFAALLEQRAPALVTVKYVYKAGQAGGEGGGEANAEAQGAVVDASGLVMLSAHHFQEQALHIRIVFGNETKEHESVLVAKDSLLELAYVHILDLGDGKVTAVDLSKGGEVEVGKPLLGLQRSGRGFDYAPEIGRLYATGRIEKPRVMWGIAGDFSTHGLPVFDLAGRPVGVLANQEGSAGAAEDDGAESATCLLPLDVVTKSIEAAKKRVPDAVAKAAKRKEGAASETPAMDEPPMGGDAPKPPDAPK